MPSLESYFLPLAFFDETNIMKTRGYAQGEEIIFNLWDFTLSSTERRLDRLTITGSCSKSSAFNTQIVATKQNK